MIQTENQPAPAKPLSEKDTIRAKAISYLRETYLKPGDIVYVILRHVGKTGMTRYLDLYVIRDNRPLRITWTVSEALDLRYDRRHESIRIGGCGFWPAHQTVHDLAWCLFNDCDALSHSWL